MDSFKKQSSFDAEELACGLKCDKRGIVLGDSQVITRVAAAFISEESLLATLETPFVVDGYQDSYNSNLNRRLAYCLVGSRVIEEVSCDVVGPWEPFWCVSPTDSDSSTRRTMKVALCQSFGAHLSAR